jgi:hypothetical protein
MSDGKAKVSELNRNKLYQNSRDFNLLDYYLLVHLKSHRNFSTPQDLWQQGMLHTEGSCASDLATKLQQSLFQRAEVCVACNGWHFGNKFPFIAFLHIIRNQS